MCQDPDPNFYIADMNYILKEALTANSVDLKKKPGNPSAGYFPNQGNVGREGKVGRRGGGEGKVGRRGESGKGGGRRGGGEGKVGRCRSFESRKEFCPRRVIVRQK